MSSSGIVVKDTIRGLLSVHVFFEKGVMFGLINLQACPF
jgi:hypothetical protein